MIDVTHPSSPQGLLNLYWGPLTRNVWAPLPRQRHATRGPDCFYDYFQRPIKGCKSYLLVKQTSAPATPAAQHAAPGLFANMGWRQVSQDQADDDGDDEALGEVPTAIDHTCALSRFTCDTLRSVRVLPVLPRARPALLSQSLSAITTDDNRGDPIVCHTTHSDEPREVTALTPRTRGVRHRPRSCPVRSPQGAAPPFMEEGCEVTPREARRRRGHGSHRVARLDRRTSWRGGIAAVEGVARGHRASRRTFDPGRGDRRLMRVMRAIARRGGWTRATGRVI